MKLDYKARLNKTHAQHRLNELPAYVRDDVMRAFASAKHLPGASLSAPHVLSDTQAGDMDNCRPKTRCFKGAELEGGGGGGGGGSGGEGGEGGGGGGGGSAEFQPTSSSRSAASSAAGPSR